MAKKSLKKHWIYGFKFILLVALVISALSVSVLVSKKQNTPCANSISCIKDLTGAYDPNSKEGEFNGKFVKVPQKLYSDLDEQAVLGDATALNKKIEIDLTNQKLYAKEGDRVVYEFLISSGKWGRTPTGNFSIWVKLNSTRMEGGNKALGTYYNLPNVPYTMYFYNEDIPKSRGYGIHGAYWHNNFGHPMSHGCINMKTAEARLLYEWTNPISAKYTIYADDNNPGTPITIYGQASS